MNTERTMDVIAKLVASLTGTVKDAMKAGMTREDVLVILQMVTAAVENSED